MLSVKIKFLSFLNSIVCSKMAGENAEEDLIIVYCGKAALY
jgi:hypothetical protein